MKYGFFREPYGYFRMSVNPNEGLLNSGSPTALFNFLPWSCQTKEAGVPTNILPGLENVLGEYFLPMMDRGPSMPGRDAEKNKSYNIARAH